MPLRFGAPDRARDERHGWAVVRGAQSREKEMHVFPSGTPALGPMGHRTYQPHRGIALRSRADALATPEWLKIKKGFEAHSIYSIETFAISPDEIVTRRPVGTQWGCTGAGCLARVRVIGGNKMP